MATDSVKSYYRTEGELYRDVWARSHIHFGLASGGRIRDIEKAGEEYARRFTVEAVGEMPLARRMVEERERLSIIEFCCGFAPLLPYLEELNLNADYLGIDVVPEHIYEISNGSGKGISPEFKVGRAEEVLDRRTKALDLALCLDSFYFIEGQGELLGNLWRLLRPGGVLAISDLAVDRSIADDERFLSSFSDRQGSPVPLKVDVIDAKPGIAPVYELDVLADEVGFRTVRATEMTASLIASYEYAVERLERREGSSSADPRDRSRYLENFRQLLAFGREGKFRLLWRVFVRSPEKSARRREEGEVLSIRSEALGFGKSGESSEKVLVEPLDFSVEAGEYVWLIGRSGTGKSTLVRIAAGLTPPGLLRTFERHVARGVKLAFVPQDPVLFEDISLRAGLELVRRGGSESRIDLDNLLLECGLEDLLEVKMGKFSRGQRQRAGISLALASEPTLLLLDEPLASQDFVTRQRMLKLLQTIRQDESITVVHVSHTWDDAIVAGDRVVEIVGGQLMEFHKGGGSDR